MARGTFDCFHCGGSNVIWDNDFSFEDYGYEGEGIMHVLHCPDCGATIEYYVPERGEQDASDARA